MTLFTYKSLKTKLHINHTYIHTHTHKQQTTRHDNRCIQ